MGLFTNDAGPSVLTAFGYEYIGARNNTTQPSRQIPDKEVEIQTFIVYVSGYTENDTTGMLFPPTDGEYFKLCKILREFPNKFREYCRMNIKKFDYILESVKNDLQGCSNIRMCIEAEEKLIVVLRYVLVIVLRININYIYTMVNAIKILCNLDLRLRLN